MSAGAIIEHVPRVHEFLIGRYGNRQPVEDKRLIAVVQRNDGGSRWPIFGQVINPSPTGDLDGVEAGTPLTLRIRESDDRGDADPFFVHATGTITFTGNPADADTLDIDDGTLVVRFEFDDDGSILGTSDVAVAIGADALETAQNLIRAINDYGVGGFRQFQIEATLDNTGANPVVDVKHTLPGTVGNNVMTDVSAALTVSGLAGGAEANEVTVRRNGVGVTTITVQPGGRAVFIMEAATKEFLRFDTDEENVQGQLVLAAWNADLTEWQRALSP